MKRIIIICEGQTEQEFCRKILYPFFIEKNILIYAPLIKKTMGGISHWNDLKKQIEITLNNDKTAFVSTLIDFYGIKEKHEFPNWEKINLKADKYEIVKILEKGISTEINNNRFLPYLQLHEFESLLFNNIESFVNNIPQSELIGMEELITLVNNDINPELINDSEINSPSKRLKRIIRGYHKIVYGIILAENIGLERMKIKNRKFNQWIEILENI